jgi:hypothetical protein
VCVWFRVYGECSRRGTMKVAASACFGWVHAHPKEEDCSASLFLMRRTEEQGKAHMFKGCRVSVDSPPLQGGENKRNHGLLLVFHGTCTICARIRR